MGSKDQVDSRQSPRGILRGPSTGLRAWATFLEERVDWLMGARRRWHEADPPKRPVRLRLMLGSGTALLAVAALIVERLLAG